MSTPKHCSEYEWMVGPLLDGELPPSEVEVVEGHLRECDTCRRLLDDFRAFDRLAQRAEEPPAVTAEEWARVWEPVRREPAVVRLGVRRGLLDWLVPALSLAALALLGAWAAFEVATHDAPPPPLPPSAREVLEPRGPGEPPRPENPPAGRRG